MATKYFGNLRRAVDISHPLVMPEPNTGCWLWLGTISGDGYGKVYRPLDGRILYKLAHRESYQAARGVIPLGLQIDHLCRNRICCNPDHLEAVTSQENTLRGERGSGDPNTCLNGHRRTTENTYFYATKYGGKRKQCKDCILARQRMSYRRKRNILRDF